MGKINFKLDENALDGDKRFFSYKKIVYVINIVGGVVIFLYAYLYLMGYFYLSSYFGDFGINTLELKFSINDYATATLYPVFNILISAIVFYLIYKFFRLILKKKVILLYMFLFTIFIFWKIYLFIDFKKNFNEHIDIFFINSLVLLCIIIFFLIYCESKGNTNQIKGYLLFLTVLILILLPILSNRNGKYIAHFNGIYAFDLILNSMTNPLVNLSTIEPIDSLKYYEVKGSLSNDEDSEIEGNSYPSLNFLIFKDDFVYFSVTKNSIQTVIVSILNKANYWEEKIENILQKVSRKLIIDNLDGSEIEKLIEARNNYKNIDLKTVKQDKRQIFKRFIELEKFLDDQNKNKYGEIRKLRNSGSENLKQLEIIKKYADNASVMLWKQSNKYENKQDFLKYLKSQYDLVATYQKSILNYLYKYIKLDTDLLNIEKHHIVFATHKNNIKSLEYVHLR